MAEQRADLDCVAHLLGRECRGGDPPETEGLAYADALTRAGVPVALLRFPDMFHPFLGFFAQSDMARCANHRIGTEAARLLGSGALPVS